MPAELTGTLVPLVTPFHSDESLNLGALSRLVDHALASGAQGLVPTALSGEGLLLDEAEILAVWDAVFAQAARRVPVVPAIITTTTRQACRLARAAEKRGASALLAAPLLPELYSGRSPEDACAFYADVAAASSLPLVLFNYPSLTGVDLVPSLVERLAAIERVRYIKESTGDASRVHDIQRRVGDRVDVICGAPQTALESFALGCRAWITGLLNVVPRSGRQLMKAVLDRRDLDLARRVYSRQVLPVFDILRRSANPTGTLKAGLRLQGIDAGAPRKPGRALDGEPLEALAKHLRALPALESSAEADLGELVRVTGIGDCGVDRYLNLRRDRPGGITLNFAVNARLLFPATDTVGVVTALGRDPESLLVRRALEAFDLETCLVEREGATSLQTIDQHPSGEKIFVRYEPGVLGDYRVGPREREVIAATDVLMAVVYAQIEALFDSVMQSPSPGLRAVDFGDLADVTGGLGIVERYLERFHVGFFGLGAGDVERIGRLESLARRSQRLLVVTLGADGSLALGDERIACPAVAVPRVIDTTGAGDAFAAGFLREYCESRRVAESLARGAQNAASTVQRLGAFSWDD